MVAKRKKTATEPRLSTASRKWKQSAESGAVSSGTAAVDAESFLNRVRELKREIESREAAKQRFILQQSSDASSAARIEVRELDCDQVLAELERVILSAAKSILEGRGLSYKVPRRSAGNQEYVEELERIVLKDGVAIRNFASVASVRKTTIMTRVLQLVHELCTRRIHTTKRDLFYTDVKLFRQQTESDDVLNDVACLIGCTRNSLNVVASEKGIVVGRVTFQEDGDLIDCTRMGVGGKAIPPYTDRITNITSDAETL
jgi:DNA topoisomerase VI subunit A